MHKLTILSVLILFIVSASLAVIPKKNTYPNPPIDFLQEDITAFGSITSGYVEAVDLTDNVVYSNVSLESNLDSDVVLRIGAVGGKVITVKAYSTIVMDNIEFLEKFILNIELVRQRLVK